MGDEECIHGLTPPTCSLCNPRKAPARPAERTTTARYEGRCPGRLGRIREGDTLGLCDGEWMCSGCWT